MCLNGRQSARTGCTKAWRWAGPLAVLCLLSTLLVGAPGVDDRRGAAAFGARSEVEVASSRAYLPLIYRSPQGCQPIPGASYGTWPIIPPPTDRPAEEHADLNLALRGYEPAEAYLGLVDYGGPTDPGAPQLTGLFAPPRIPAIVSAYRVHHWDWECNCRGPVIMDPPVTLIAVGARPGERVTVPPSGYDIGGGYEVLVLYAASDRITLKYTGEDNVVYGYTVHVENICVDPGLLTLYEQWNAAGRSRLPALGAGQAFGYSVGSSYGVAIRDTGAFMDPRSHLDWWR
jgi:hypothetical protein